MQNFYCNNKIANSIQNEVNNFKLFLNILKIFSKKFNLHFLLQKCELQTSKNAETRKIFIVRHGERIDLTFRHWMTYCFDANGLYVRKDLNLPKSLPKRSNYPHAYATDSPLTNIGITQATLLGEAMYDQKIQLGHVFTSPTLRCIQTCDAILTGLKAKQTLPIKIEPGLFEFLFVESDKYQWLTNDELINEFHVNIDRNYESVWSETDLKSGQKTCDEFYKCYQTIFNNILKRYSTGDILIVGHSVTLDASFRALICNGKSRSRIQMSNVINQIPYCATITFELDPVQGWRFCESYLAPVSNAKNFPFHSTIFFS